MMQNAKDQERIIPTVEGSGILQCCIVGKVGPVQYLAELRSWISAYSVLDLFRKTLIFMYKRLLKSLGNEISLETFTGANHLLHSNALFREL